MDCSHRWYSSLSSSYTCKILCTYRKNHFSHPWYNSHYIQNCCFYPVFVCCMLPVFSEDSCWLCLSFFSLTALANVASPLHFHFVCIKWAFLYCSLPPYLASLICCIILACLILQEGGLTCNLPNCVLNTFHALIVALPHIPEKLPFKS